MIYTNNTFFMKNNFPKVIEFIEDYKNAEEQAAASIVLAKNGMPNLAVEIEGTRKYVHSQYDPLVEAERIIADYIEEAAKAKHIYFFGVGLGYHINELLKVNPQVPYTLHEPEVGIFNKLLQSRELTEFPLNLKNIFLGHNFKVYLSYFLNNFTTEVLIVIHPFYERMYPGIVTNFANTFKTVVADRKIALHTNFSYERLWTFNIECNFKKIIQTQNIIREKKHLFLGKPALLVAAGPSLQDEFDNLRYIKENKLAYIFAVGSANKALIVQGVFPDAVISYDPNTNNHEVYREIIDQNITTIPLIFGSTVGFKTLELYPGPKLHMIINQDQLTPYYLGDEEQGFEQEIITDAPSVAVIAMELLYKLGFNFITLVGQNFAFRNDQYYAEGISYDSRSTKLSDEEKAAHEEVESVDGGYTYTVHTHNLARKQMESVIAMSGNIEVINSTKGGAKIEGTVFVPLEETIRNRLTVPIVDPHWYIGDKTYYNTSALEEKMIEMEEHYTSLRELLFEIVKRIKQLDNLSRDKSAKKIANLLNKIGVLNKQIYANLYYQIYIRPMIRVHYDIFQIALVEVNSTFNMNERAQKVVQSLGVFILHCQECVRDNESFYRMMRSSIYSFLEDEKMKFVEETAQ